MLDSSVSDQQFVGDHTTQGPNDISQLGEQSGSDLYQVHVKIERLSCFFLVIITITFIILHRIKSVSTKAVRLKLSFLMLRSMSMN